MLLRLASAPLGGCLALLSLSPLLAGTIESQPIREWVSGNGSKLNARLAFFTDHQRQATTQPYVLLIPDELARPPVSVLQSALSREDQAYLETIKFPRGYRSDFQNMTQSPLVYADGESVPGRLRGYNSRERLVIFESEKPRSYFALQLDSLSAESIEFLTKAYNILPPLETPLSSRLPLPATLSDTLRFELKNMPMVKQVGSYCVPASAEMIARFHNLRENQYRLAHLSSDASRQHKGTWSGDMANAMESIGFLSETCVWAGLDTDRDFERFKKDVLPFIQHSLQQDGPLYVSFKPGVYGNSGHGCVVVGYNHHGQGLIHIHNPWGKRETYSYRDFFEKAREVVRFHWQEPAAGEAAAVEKAIVAALPRMPMDLTDAMNLLKAGGLKPALRLHGRRDRRDDRFQIERWALAQGKRAVDSTLEHHAACLIPFTKDDRILGWYLLRLEGDNPNPLARPRGLQGWSEPARLPIDTILKTWSTPVNLPGETAWDMPLIEVDA